MSTFILMMLRKCFKLLKKIKQSSPLIVSVIISAFNYSLLSAQEDSSQKVKYPRNGIGVYIGLFEINLNYERNIIQQPKSQTHARFGVGAWTDMQSGGKYINGSIVQLIGRKRSRIEFNLGLKLILSGTDLHFESPRTFLIPDIYLGYYYESQKSREYFRAGLSYPSLFNIGGGLRF